MNTKHPGLQALQRERAGVERELAAWSNRRREIAARLEAMAGATDTAAAGLESAKAALATALAAGDTEATAKARQGLAGAAEAHQRAAGNQAEADALRAALDALDAEHGQYAARLQAIADRERELFRARLDELAAEVSREQRNAVRRLAEGNARACALNWLSDSAGGPLKYAPMAAPPVVVVQGLGANREQVVEPIAERVPASRRDLADMLRAEGWSLVR